MNLQLFSPLMYKFLSLSWLSPLSLHQSVPLGLRGKELGLRNSRGMVILTQSLLQKLLGLSWSENRIVSIKSRFQCTFQEMWAAAKSFEGRSIWSWCFFQEDEGRWKLAKVRDLASVWWRTWGVHGFSVLSFFSWNMESLENHATIEPIISGDGGDLKQT